MTRPAVVFIFLCHEVRGGDPVHNIPRRQIRHRRRIVIHLRALLLGARGRLSRYPEKTTRPTNWLRADLPRNPRRLRRPVRGSRRQVRGSLFDGRAPLPDQADGGVPTVPERSSSLAANAGHACRRLRLRRRPRARCARPRSGRPLGQLGRAKASLLRADRRDGHGRSCRFAVAPLTVRTHIACGGAVARAARRVGLHTR
mmetsp:Transcript_52541/g.170722  ORF Transcript_52541/g.170722 Transcript_52541/m.170722 type:complete len:200 (+) Transcript_52541:116-715(+)